MTAYNFRSLLLAAIVLSNCITWTASRHHHAHNVHQHRTRHRRQGAGLYLPASYIIPGGEGSGPWGDWGDISPCSRTCGGGVASQKRICLEPGPQNSCTGGDTKYFSCQTQDCPAGSGDFRAEQCAEFNDKEFRGYKYNWVPYTKAPNPCELNCMPQAERFYFRHKLRVADGTRCNDDSFDVCVDGVCQHVGCDMMLGSSASEDKCRVCRGNGTNCHTIEGLFDSQDLLKGYNDILLIPEGSTTIIIEEIEPSNNYLALRAKNDTYYLNGHYHIDFPRTIMIAGALWTYERSQQGFPAPDKLRCLGPITEPLYLSLLLQDVNVGIKYEYSIPNDATPPTDRQYNWVHEEFTPCSATCGGGFQTRNVTCRSREELELVDDKLCDEGLKPPTNQSCNQDPCPAQWVAGPWGDCSQRCGSGGTRSREVTCQKVIANGIASIVPDKECFDLLGPKPELFQKCNEDAPCPDWFVGHWKPCDQLCDEGKQTRQVVCRQKIDGRVKVLDDGNCTDEKPATEQTCMIQPCDGVDWVTSDWSGCDTCFSKLRTRTVTCATKGSQVLNDSFCMYHTRPVDQEECDEAKLPPCEVQWYATQWSKCSVQCGDGVKTRKVFCGLLNDNSVEKVEDSKCAHLPKYNDTKPCTVPKEECPSQWFAGPWSECTEKCGGGEQVRRVMCLRGSEEASGCPPKTVLDSTQFCNTGPCDKDDLLPVDKMSTVVMDADEDDDYCDEDADMEEVGLDLDLTSTTADLALSDSPTSYAEHEVSLDTGSGFSSLSTVDLTTDEGSGFSSTSTDTTYSTDYDDGSGDSTLKFSVSTVTTRKPPTLEPDDVTVTGSTSTDTDSTSSETGSTPTGSTDETGTGDTSSTDGSSTNSTGSTESTPTDETGATSSTEAATKNTDATGSTTELSSNSTESDSTSSDDSTKTTTKDITGSTAEEDTSSTESSLSTDVKETGSTEATSLAASESTGTDTSSGTSGTESSDASSDSTKTTVTGEETSTENVSTASIGTDDTTLTGETDSTVTKETSGSESTSSKNTGSTESTVTGETSSTESTVTGETSSTGSAPTDTSSASESVPTKTSDATESLPTESSSATESTPTETSSATESELTKTSGATESAPTGTSGATESAPTETSSATEAAPTGTSGATESAPTGTSDATESTPTETSNGSESTPTDASSVTESTVTEESSPSESTATEDTDTTGTTDASETDTTVTDVTGASTDTGSTDTEATTDDLSTTDLTTSSVFKVSTMTTKKMPKETTPAETSTSDSSGSTTETVESSTSSGLTTGESDSTTEEAGSTTVESGSTTGKTGSTTGESDSTTVESESTTAKSGLTTVESGSTTGETGSTTGESGSTTVESESTTTVSGSTTVESGSTNKETGSTTGESVSTTVESESTTAESDSSTTESGLTTVESGLSTTDSDSTTVESGSTTVGSESTTVESESTTGKSGSTTAGSESTTEESGSTTAGSTTEKTEESTTVGAETTTEAVESSSLAESTESKSTTEVVSTTPEGETTTEAAGSSLSGSTEESSASESESTVEGESTTVSGSESTTESSGSSTEQSTSESSESTAESSSLSESTTGSETSTISESSTTVEGTEETTGLSGLTTTEGVVTIKSTWHDILLTKKTCKPRRKAKCNKTKFGCCPDNKTEALGPFDEGCHKPRTCQESRYGCCPDGVSPKLGETDEGCPVEPCADTLFGCCLSDNKTAAQGNDQEGCPPPPPACASSEFGCCADNETEATGPEKAGCPETETSTTGAGTETTTEALETSEGSTTGADTTAAGTTEVGSTTMEDLCSDFEFGCCADNQTEAKGPDGQGCPCNATEFGCCPDGVSAAKGADNEGCPGSCSTSPHGCCEDNQTPAHGPDFEGCCLLHAFGCCPDNRKPAEGPHLEGCGCQYSLHGCCPDNVTIAQGPDNQGCGCQYTQHGCCPDRHTAASGPNNEGCDCSTFQFGCCPDGVTTAKGPDQQGCHCRYSSYGCCGDEQTPATGPNAAGCDCSSSKYGCCPDGKTEAAGSKFLGCTDAPENKQAACSLPTDPGSCHNFTAMWYFDMTYGGCSRFWYGGCEGNGNRFTTKEECEDICVQPSPKDACNLPSVKGACDGSYEHWHYNSTREQCVPFLYGGCLGNANNFETRELCQKQCEPRTEEGQCELPIEPGSCSGNYSRWGFNPSTRGCEQFIWGGCEGNSNRFNTEAACQMRCNPPGSQPPQCAEPQEAGSCANKEALWSFSVSENRCVPFYYSGCGGNNNRFPSREACEQTCPAAYVPDKCTLPAETGQCANYRQRWFFDTTFKRCRQFYYGGCGGNENNFATEAECENSCSELKTTTTTTTTIPTTTTTTARPAEPRPQPGPEEPTRPDFCYLEIDSGPCDSMQTRYAYDSKQGRCVTFEYGGCAGNRNNFPDLQYCTFYCQPIPDICQLPMLAGPCNDSQMRWFYDDKTDSCSQFTYGGCEGNDNRFESREACESRCKIGQVPAATTPSTTVAVDSRFGETLAAECKVTESLEECQHGGQVWYFAREQGECVSFSNQESGAACRHTGTFTSQEACERSCGAFRGVDVCKQRMDPGPCQSYVTKVYFDAATGQCREFSFGGCLGGANRFSTMDECNQVCATEIADPCTLPPEAGSCTLYVQQWYYDPTRDQCNRFVFTGCGGNANRFETQRDCESRCKRPEPRTTTTEAPQPQPQGEPECRTPPSLQPCGNNVTVFYYDAERRQCRVGGFGGCGYENSYSTEEECERRCGAFRGIDVCGAPLDPGPCRAAFPKIYYDSISGSCEPYTYGGCGGGPNRFSNIEECENVCGGRGPAPECLQAVDTGESCGVAASQRWHYSVAHVDCVVFAYLGCGGNDNNFRSYDECADICGLSHTSGRDDPNQVIVPVPDCRAAQQECEALDCQFGIARFTQDGCQRCQCNDDPCTRANCSANERCEAVAIRNPAYPEPQYSATCVEETNEVYDCEEYVANCSRLRCEYNVQHTRLPNGCEQCSCVPLEIDCQPLTIECENIKCNYGVQKFMGADGCQRCSCKEHPCEKKFCPAGDRCVVIAYNDGIDLVTKYTADCRTVTKPGYCPMDETTTNEVTCRHECNDDADCRGVGKCCRRGCSDLCLEPVEQTSAPPIINTTLAPNVPAAPQPLPQKEPEVAASEGGKATLRCLFHGNPPPKITWKHGELTIDGSAGRYRLMSDGALEIVSLYRNDTGVYICVADNGLGIATQEIHLVVNDPVRAPVGIAGDENAVVTGELGSPLSVRCLAYGYPPPTVFWYRGYDGTMVPYNDAVFEARGNVLLIRSLAIETLGQYTCQAYNGEGKAASWVVNVRAYRPEGLFIENEMLVPRVTLSPRPKTQAPTTAESTSTTSTTTEARIPVYTVPVSAHVSSAYSTLNVGTDLQVTCDVDGFPAPDVYWTKDGARLQNNDRVLITGSEVVSRLRVRRVSVSDSGLYACHASNPYTSQTDTAQINVQQLMVPAKCTDNPFFANCDLIVRSNFCRHKYYSKFCCKSCVEAGQLDPQEAELQADQPLKKK